MAKQSCILEFCGGKKAVKQERIVAQGVVCPVCTISLDAMRIEEREAHVDRCLSVDTLTATTSYRSVKVESSPAPKRAKKSPQGKDHTKKRKRTKTPAKERTPRLPKATIPEFKILDLGTKIAVDAFCFAPDETIDVYLLSHFHSDHYGGMCKSWNRGRVIVATGATARLAVGKFKLPEELFFTVEYGEKKRIPGTEVDVTCFDANHCPGGGIFVLEGCGRRYLHCGDFRVNRRMIEQLIPYKWFDRVYLDDTYLDPQHSFPRQEDVIEAVSRVVVAKSEEAKAGGGRGRGGGRGVGHGVQQRLTDMFGLSTASATKEFLVVVGTYSLGKERLAIEIAKRLGSKIFCDERKADTFGRLQWGDLDELLETDPEKACECRVHLVTLMGMNKASLRNYLKKYDRHYKSVVGISPTGWAYRHRPIAMPEDKTDPSYLDQFIDAPKMAEVELSALNQINSRNKEERQKGLVISKTLTVPYSEHSSFRELFYFVNRVPCGRWIPTVNTSSMETNEMWISMFQKHAKLDLSGL